MKTNYRQIEFSAGQSIESAVKELKEHKDLVCGRLVALTVGKALKLNRITAVDFSTSTAITQNTCYAPVLLIVKL